MTDPDDPNLDHRLSFWLLVLALIPFMVWGELLTRWEEWRRR